MNTKRTSCDLATKTNVTCNVLATAIAAVASALPTYAKAAVGRTEGTYSVSSTGAATYQIPLWVSPGAGGVQPSLTLTYTSRGGSGIAGPGWSLSGLSAITRCIKTVAQDTVPSNITLTYADAFCLDGQRLRLTSGGGLGTYGQAGTTYDTEQATFSLVTALGAMGNGPQSFEVKGKNGLIYEFGNTADSRISSSTSVPTAYMWLVNKVRDRFGNSYVVTYGTGASGSVGIGVPMTIAYSPATAGGSTYINTVTFDYTTKAAQVPNPNDPASVGYVDGVGVTNTNLLLAIKVNSNGTLMRRYALTYETAPTTVRARLKTIIECTSADASNCLLPTNITYNNGASGVSTATTLTLANHRVVARKDIDGDGKEDLVLEEMSGVTPINVKVAFSTGTGFGTPVVVHASTLLAFGIGDFLGKGTNDIIVTSGMLGPYTRYSWNGTQFVATPLPLPTTGIYQGQARASDVGGDGRDDLLFDFKSCQTCAFATNLYASTSVNGSVTFAAPIAFSIGPPELSGSPNAQNQPFDFDGDGRQDWLTSTFNQTTGQRFINVILSRTDHTDGGASQQISGLGYIVGYARINDDSCTDIIAESSIYLSPCNGQAPVLVGFTGTAIGAMDWNSDGRTDVLVQNFANFGVLLSTGTTFAPLLNTVIPVSTQSAQNVFVLDLDGDGQDDLGTWDTTGIKLYRHNSPGMPPDLAASITDGYGVGVTLAYASNAARTENSYPNPVYPERDYRGPMILCSSVTVTSGASDGSAATFSRSFSYSGARTDMTGRGFLGFTQIRSTDSRNTIVRDIFRRTAFPLTGMVYQDDVRQSSSGSLISHATFVQGTNDLDATTNNRRVFAFTNSTNRVVYEVGGALDGAAVRTTATTMTYDSFGNATNIATTVTDSQSTSPQFGQQWTSTVAYTVSPNTANWCLNLPSQSTVTNTAPGTPTLTRTTSFGIDYSSCRVTQQTIEPGDVRWEIKNSFGFDGFGNLASITVTPKGQTARTSTINWTTYAGRFPDSATEPVTSTLSHSATFTWDAARGVQTGFTDSNGLQTVLAYDSFGRLAQQTQPDNTRTVHALTACDSSNSFCGSPTLRSKVVTTLRSPSDVVQRTDTVYSDQFDRAQKTVSQLLGSNFQEVTQTFDAFGRLSAESFPHPADATSAATTYTYDLISRLSRVRRPVSATDPSNHDTLLDYRGLSVVQTDALLRQTTQRSNAAGLIAQAFDAAGSDTDYEYDAFGRLLKTRDVLGNESVFTYNVRGMKMSSSDPDLGGWQYDYFATGELKSQTDAKAQTVSFTYDYLARMLTRSEAEGTTTWTWGTSAASHNIGRLSGIAAPGYSEAYTYDTFARLANRRIDSDATYFYDYTYDPATGALSTLEYPASTGPSRLKLEYVYDNALLQQIKDANAGTVYWQANTVNPFGQVTQETLGNGVVTNRAYDAVTGRPSSIQSGIGGGATLQNESYLFDKVGNLTQRQQGQLSLTENFYYDNLDRLDYSTLGGTTNLNLDYDAIGNITSRSDVGGGATWTYHTTKKHAVVQAGSNTYSYDANGNAQTRNGFVINWTTYNYPSEINGSGKKLTFDYGPDRQRYRQVYKNGSLTETTMYIGGMLEKVTIGNVTDYRHYITANGGAVAIVSRRSDGLNATRYLLKDFLGSISSILNSNGTAFTNESFAAFGGRRDAQAWSGPCPCPTLSQVASVTRRGFTGHEMIGGHSMGLIHMNGRVFDSTIGRFLSADPYVPDPLSSQSLNRYSYLSNNPLSGTDPTGFYPGENDRPNHPRFFLAYELYDWNLTQRERFRRDLWQQSRGWGTGGPPPPDTYVPPSAPPETHVPPPPDTQVPPPPDTQPTTQVPPPPRPTSPGTPADGTTWQAGLIGPSVQASGELQSTAGGGSSTYSFVGAIRNFIRGSRYGHSEFSIGDKPFNVIGGAPADRIRVEADLRAIFKTPRGTQMLAQLETRRSFYFFKSDLVVDLTVANNAYAYAGEDAIFVDPNFHPVIQTTIGVVPASTLRILGHELGHAAFGTLDDGPGRMNNVLQNENPIMRALGQPDRTRY